MADKKTCFVIGPIGDPDTEIRKWSDTICNYVITPAVTACGYKKPVRADQISKSGMITLEIMEHLIKDDLVVADLTGPNANVFYELGIRHAARKAFVQLIRKGQNNPFDTKDLRTIKVDTGIEAATEALEQLKAYIPEVEKQGEDIYTPISVVAQIEILRASGDTQQEMLADLLKKVDEISSTTHFIKNIFPELLVHKFSSMASASTYEDTKKFAERVKQEEALTKAFDEPANEDVDKALDEGLHYP